MFPDLQVFAFAKGEEELASWRSFHRRRAQVNFYGISYSEDSRWKHPHETVLNPRLLLQRFQ